MYTKKSNVIDFKLKIKQKAAKEYCTMYKSLSEKYVLMIIDELEQKGYPIRGNEDMLDEFMFLKDVINLVSQSCSREISDEDKNILENLIHISDIHVEENNDTV